MFTNLSFYRLSFLVLGIVFFTNLSSYAQMVLLKGQITDSTKTALAFAHIMAIPRDSAKHTAMSMSKEGGRFEIKLSANTVYDVNVGYLGFQNKVFELRVQETDVIQNIVLQPTANKLKEVIVFEKPPPVMIKPDTIIYDVDSFVTGDERKLKDVLEKLPGVKVDDEGRVFVNGVRVSKIMVENKAFFGNNSNIAVKYIPADAVDKIEVIDNYSEVDFLKGTELVMNVKLKAGKKQFAFGEVKGGYDGKNSYALAPNLFYYGKNYTLSGIGNWNNAGLIPFSFRDYLQFSGGMSQFLDQSLSVQNLDTETLKMFLKQDERWKSQEKFGAVNFVADLSEKLELSSFLIFSGKNTSLRTEESNQYFVDNQQNFNEIAVTEEQNQHLLGVGKIKLRYKPQKNKQLFYETFFRLGDHSTQNYTTSESVFQSAAVDILETQTSTRINQELRYHAKHQHKQYSTLVVNHDYNTATPNTNWAINGLAIQSIIPIQSDSIVNILQDKKIKTQDSQVVYQYQKDVGTSQQWVVKTGVRRIMQHWINEDYQVLQGGQVHGFWANDFILETRSAFVEPTYKFLKKGLKAEVGSSFYAYQWNSQQSTDTSQHFRWLCLPKFSAEWEINRIGKFSLKYHVTNELPSMNNLVANRLLNGYNSVFQGNPALSNVLTQVLNIGYSKFNLASKTTFYTYFNYQLGRRNIYNQTLLEGINQLLTPVNNSVPLKSLSWRNSWSRDFKIFNLTPVFDIFHTRFSQNVNGVDLATTRLYFRYGGHLQTKFEQPLTIKLSYYQRKNQYDIGATKNTFTTIEPAISVKYKWAKHFLLTVESQSTFVRNEQPFSFNMTNAALAYQKKESPWGMELEIRNLMNVTSKWSNTFSNFFISERNIFVFPRVALFHLNYVF